IEALPQSRRELVDEAELAVVVTRLHAIEQGRVDLDAEWLPGGLRDLDCESETPPVDVDAHVGVVGQDAVLDDVARDVSVDPHDMVARHQSGPSRGRSGRDSNDPGGRHEGQYDRGAPRIPYGPGRRPG